MIKIFISGSCVSRDTLEFLNSDSFKLVAYHARSSFCTHASKSIPLSSFKKSLENISSPFQKRMVENDFSQKLFTNLQLNNFDILLLDLIDERFHIAVLEKQYYVTRSTEFIKTEILPTSLINSHSDKFFELWTSGINRFISELKDKNCLDKLRVQKAFWSNTLDTGEKISSVSDDVIKKENLKLSKMYNYLENILDNSQFINFPPNLLIIKSDHKWGVSPFHYIDDYYVFLNKSLALI